MKLLIPKLILFGGVLVSLQVRGDAPEADEKRSISALARTGQLPPAGKRYVAALAKNGQLSRFTRPSWKKKLHQILEENSSLDEGIDEQKRYVGALAKTGDLKVTRYRNDKRDEVDSLIDELMTAEELRRLRLEILREELLREQEEQSANVRDDEDDDENDQAEEKRSLSSLVRSGSIPYTPGKRGIAALAKNGDFPWSDGKRGGISSLMRNRFNRKRAVDSELNDLMEELSDENDYNLQTAKRNLASFAKSGGLSGLAYRNEKKDLFDNWDRSETDTKRNIQSVLRNRMAPFVEGKRYVGAFFARNGKPPYISRDPNFKRNIGSMARGGWGVYDRFRPMKRDGNFDEFEAEDTDEIAKRYVAALLRQGRLPVGNDGSSYETQEEGDEPEQKEELTDVEEEKRHIGSIAAQNNIAMRKKKSINANEHIDENKNSENHSENVNENDVNNSHRAKREIYYDSSEEYPMPVLQNTVNSDYEDIMSKVSGDGPSARNKRYFAVRGGGKIPGGRLPQIGSRRGTHNHNSGRRRGHY